MMPPVHSMTNVIRRQTFNLIVVYHYSNLRTSKMAEIKATVLHDADRLESNFNISDTGAPVWDPDFMARTLPADLSQDMINRVIDHIDHTGAVVEVIVARKAVLAAKDNAELQEVSTSVRFNDRMSFNTRWDRSGRRATESGHRGARGIVSSSLSMRTDTDRQNTYDALEQLADAMLG